MSVSSVLVVDVVLRALKCVCKISVSSEGCSLWSKACLLDQCE